jgi:hypothetical protein
MTNKGADTVTQPKKQINFHKTSNMAIEIKELFCLYCNGVFYELDSRELDECPLCENRFNSEPSENDYDSETYTLIVDPKTGVPSVIRNDEYEPVRRDKA